MPTPLPTPSDLMERLASHATVGAAPRPDLEWLVAHGTLMEYAADEVITVKGSAVSYLFVILDGHLAIFIDRGTGVKKVTEWRTGDVTGMLPFSRMTASPGSTISVERTTVLAIPGEHLPALVRDCYGLTSILVHKMLDRARLFTTSDLHDEKMASLGRLSAGLAHELNNPAAAIERSASVLDDRIEEAERATLALGAARLTADQLAAIERVRAACMAPRPKGVLSPLQQADREQALADWLDDHGVDASLSEALADTSVKTDALDAIAQAVEGPPLAAALRWAAAGCSLRALSAEILDASTRISGLVAAVKGFTHMDQGSSAEPFDLAFNLGNTVTVLRAKARARSAAVTLDIPADLPPVYGFVGELNQVWANLLDNALDAVPDQGRVDIVARAEAGQVVVHIIDNGTGIPRDVQERMFDPFFTTKPVGKGTGLGLDIVRRLVAHNDARIDVESAPGRTVFSVTLPVPARPDDSGARP